MDSDHDFDCIPPRFRGLIARLLSEQLVARLHVMWLDTKLKDEVHEEGVTKTHSNTAAAESLGCCCQIQAESKTTTF